jgi:hypothetical protein
VKITGAEWKQFEAEGWPKGYIWADESTLDDGTDLYPEDAPEGVLSVADGDTFVVPSWWGVGVEEADTRRIAGDTGDGVSVRTLIRRWRKQRDNEVLVVTVPKQESDRARALLSKQGWAVA